MFGYIKKGRGVDWLGVEEFWNGGNLQFVKVSMFYLRIAVWLVYNRSGEVRLDLVGC